MADGDIVIADSATEAAPHEYVVKGAEYFAIKQVQAHFTDNGAAGAWLPALEIVAPPGIVTGRYVGSSVAAGSDQEVTFAPFLRGATAATPSAGVNVPLGFGIDFSTTLAAGFNVTMNLADFFATTDGAVYSTLLVGGLTFLQILEAGIYRAQAQTAAADTTDTGIITLGWFWNFGGGHVDSCDLDTGQPAVAQYTRGGLNHWQLTSDTYFGIDHPANTAVTVQVNCTTITGNLSTQQTNVIFTRIGDYVPGVIL